VRLPDFRSEIHIRRIPQIKRLFFDTAPYLCAIRFQAMANARLRPSIV
jgi:hypothetical protein